MNAELPTYQIRVVPSSWWPRGRSFLHDGCLYSDGIGLQKADALLALYDPTEELLKFDGPKLWYTYEPMWHNHYRRHPVGRKLVKHLLRSEWVYFANPDPAFRVAHITWGNDLSKQRVKASPRNAAIACVTNFGGRFWFLKRHIWLRNRMVLQSNVELFGRREAWSQFRHFPAIWRRGTPPNYRGELAGNHMDDQFREFLSGYKVCLCLENSCEPFYFTEKFVNAVRAGCVPVYHAHPSVAAKFLRGAKWVDPAQHGFSARRTIDFALAADGMEFQKANDTWLESGILDETGFLGFFNRLHALIKAKLTDSVPVPMSAEKCRSFTA